ncbi:hypothetical protein AGMMS4952_26770 [Spirochaetia bacterium]|nr:hypothetical protein AGMMS4952_26770 [Spirochaetia bacterium]
MQIFLSIVLFGIAIAGIWPTPSALKAASSGSLPWQQGFGKQSRTDIARKLGLSYQAYQRLENPGKANPTIKTLERIAHVFGQELSVQIG